MNAPPSIELLWWDGCPSTPKAAELVREAMSAEGIDPATLQLREIPTDAEAERERFIGSPTVRVGGRDIAPVDGEPSGLTCRIYRLRDGRVSPTPDPQSIREAIREASR